MGGSVGFGCSRLSYHLTTARGIRNLECAFDEGIDHFDCAPLDGFGAAEGILGQFASNKRSRITITTKLGSEPGSSLLRNLFIQNTLRQAWRFAGSEFSDKVTEYAARPAFSPEQLRNSLENSLRELRTDYVDYLLLHEFSLGDVNTDDLVEALDRLKAAGKIRQYGVTADVRKLAPPSPALANSCSIVQTDHSFPYPLSSRFDEAGDDRQFFFSSPFRHLGIVRKRLLDDLELRIRAIELLDVDAVKPEVDLCLLHQLLNDRRGTFIFTTRLNRKIRDVVARLRRLSDSTSDEFKRDFEEIRRCIAESV